MNKKTWCSLTEEELKKLSKKEPKGKVEIIIFNGKVVFNISGHIDGYDRNIIIKEFMKAYQHFKIWLVKGEVKGEPANLKEE